MQKISMHAAVFIVACAAALAGCGGHGGAIPARTQGTHISPADVKPAPMAVTKKLPSSAMHTVKPAADFSGSGWTQIPGAATQAAAAPDGSLWVLSTDPAGKDKYIWHYANGTWTNIPGEASQLAPAPDGSLFVINSGGGTYHYANGSWTALGGGAAALTVASDGSTYVASNDGSYTIWKNTNGSWSLVGGSGTLLAANLDGNTYTVPGGTVGPYGLFVVNSSGGIYYTDGTHPYLGFPGAASSVAPTNGGVYVLAYPINPNGNTIFYYDYTAGSWKQEPGSGVSVSANNTDIYVVSANGAIYTTKLGQPLSASPASISVLGTGSSNMQIFVVSGGVGSYKAGGYDSNVISVSADQYDPSQFDVTGVAAGSTTITITDGAGATLAVPVTVTTASGTVN